MAEAKWAHTAREVARAMTPAQTPNRERPEPRSPSPGADVSRIRRNQTRLTREAAAGNPCAGRLRIKHEAKASDERLRPRQIPAGIEEGRPVRCPLGADPGSSAARRRGAV